MAVRKLILAASSFGGELMTVWVVLVALSLIILAAEAVYILPDKMPWNRKKGKK